MFGVQHSNGASADTIQPSRKWIIQDDGLKTLNAKNFAPRLDKYEIPTANGKIQDGGLHTSNACISASRQNINEIPTVVPMFSGYSFTLRLMRKLCDKTGSGQIQNGGLYTSNVCISACTLDINAIPTTTPMVFGSSFPTGLGRIPRSNRK